MSILFSAVAYQKTIFNKYASCDGNFEEILDEVLLKIPSRNNKMTYYHGRYLFHYILVDEYFYFCVTDKLCQRSRAFLFLNEIKRQFEFNKKKFTNVLSEQMYRYNEDYSTILIGRGEIEELNTISVDSSESILGEKILFVSNDNNLKYTIISSVEKVPEHVEITFKKSKSYIFVIATLIIAAFIIMFIFGPVPYHLWTFVVLTLILLRVFHKKLCDK